MQQQDIDALLDALDQCARSGGPYPPRGLGLHGDTSKRDELRLLVEEWAAVHCVARCG